MLNNSFEFSLFIVIIFEIYILIGNVEQILVGQKVLESSRWKLEASANASHLPKKKRIGKF